MASLAELQPNFVHLPAPGGGETIVEFDAERIELNGLRDRALVLDVLEEAARQGIELGGDEASYVPEDLQTEVEELRHEWMVEPDEPITLTGDEAEHIYSIFKVVADTDQIEREIRNEALLMLGKPLIKEPPEENKQPRSYDEANREAHIQLERMKKIGGKTTSSLIETQPDKSTNKQKRRLSIRNETEMLGATRALSSVTGGNPETPAGALIQKLEGAVAAHGAEEVDSRYLAEPIELSSRESKLVYGALRLMANGLTSNERQGKNPPVSDYDKANARYMLEAWQGRSKTNEHIAQDMVKASVELKPVNSSRVDSLPQDIHYRHAA